MVCGVVGSFGINRVFSTGSRFYLFKMDRDENNEIVRMKEVYSAECSPGIKWVCRACSTGSSYASNLGGVWKPLYTLMKNAEKHVKTSGMCFFS